MITLTQDKLTFRLMLTSSTKEVTLTVNSEVKLPKTLCPLAGRVTKETTMILRINEDYEEAVNAMRLEEGVKGTFKAKPRAWGTRIEREDGLPTPLIEHNNETYLAGQVVGANDPVYFVDGVEANPNQLRVIKAFLPEKKEDSGRQKVDEAIVHRTIKISNIVQINLDGTEYKVR